MLKRSPLERRLRQRGKTWHFWAYDYSGKRYECSTHQTDKQAAIKAARRIERERADGPVAEARVCTLARAFELLAARDTRVAARPKTVAFHKERQAHLVRLLGADTLCDSLTVAALNRYTDTRLAEGAHRHTVQKEHRVLRQAIKCAVTEKVCSLDPKTLQVDGFGKRRQFYTPGKRWLERAEYVAALLEEITPYRRDDILVFCNLGVRRREPLTFTPGRVNLLGRTVQVDELGAITVKTEKSTRALPLNDAMVEVFTRRLSGAKPGQPLFCEWSSGNRDLQAAWTRARTKLVTQDEALDYVLPMVLTFTDLRRTCCSLLKNAGVSLETCADLLGHEDISMVRLVYGQPSMPAMHAAVARLPTMTAPQDSCHSPTTI